jgi:hypothetical protein
MAWHRDLAAEIAAEFDALAMSEAEWAERARDIHTARRKAINDRYKARLRTRLAGSRTCTACGSRFTVTAEKVRSQRVRVCSERCRVAATRRYRAFLTIRGETLPLAVWAARSGVAQMTIWCRINRYGWDVARAVFEPAAKSASQRRAA